MQGALAGDVLRGEGLREGKGDSELSHWHLFGSAVIVLDSCKNVGGDGWGVDGWGGVWDWMTDEKWVDGMGNGPEGGLAGGQLSGRPSSLRTLNPGGFGSARPYYATTPTNKLIFLVWRKTRGGT